MEGQSWRDFCRALEAAGDLVLARTTPATPIDRAEGYRYLTRLARIGLEMMLEHADPDFPTFYAASHPTGKIGGDNPDNLYQNATIAGDREYRIWGRRNTVPYLSFGTKANRYATEGTMASTGELEAAEMVFGRDGSFEIAVSRERKPGNWLPIAADSSICSCGRRSRPRGKSRPTCASNGSVGPGNPSHSHPRGWIAVSPLQRPSSPARHEPSSTGSRSSAGTRTRSRPSLRRPATAPAATRSSTTCTATGSSAPTRRS
jgi:hypothetical protein